MNNFLKLLLVSLPIAIHSYGGNPLITNIYTADPAAHQFSDGKLYLYADYDPYGENGGWLNMYKYHVYSTSDLKIWTDHGSLFDCKDITWNDGAAWDGDCVEANGKYYYYFPMVDIIGVAVADKPTGPFKDALGKPLITRNTPGVQKIAKGWLTSCNIVFYKDTAYMYMGQNEEFYVAKLKKNMLELDGPVITLSKPKYFHEGAWINLSGGKFHVTYGGSDGKGKDKLCYAVGTNPYGPFTFQNFVQSDRAETVQSCVTDFNGKHILFYHQNGKDGYHRQICADFFEYNKKGNIPKVPRTKKGLGSTELRIDALGKQEAEDCQELSGWGINRQLEPNGEGNWYINVYCQNTWMKFEKVDFGNGVNTFETSISSGVKVTDGKIEIRLDRPDGPIIGECLLPNHSFWFNWEKTNCSISNKATGVHDVYYVMKGNSSTQFNYSVNYMIDNLRYR